MRVLFRSWGTPQVRWLGSARGRMHGGCVACMQRDRQRCRHGSAFILRPLQGSAAYGRAAEALLLARPQKAGGGIPLLACAMALLRATSRALRRLRTSPFYSHGFLRIILICEYHRPQGSAIAAVPCFIVGRPTGFSLQWSFLLANGSPCSQAFFSTLTISRRLRTRTAKAHSMDLARSVFRK